MTQTPQQQTAGKIKIMPGIGCLARRLYIEKYLSNLTSMDPCNLCEYRYNQCKKIVVSF